MPDLRRLGGGSVRVVTFGSDHPFTAAAVGVVRELEGFEQVGHVESRDERCFLRVPNSEQAQRFLAGLQPGLFLSSGYGRILSAQTLALAAIGGINVHPSLLPRFRGRDVVRWALYEGASEIGLTIHEMTLPVDSGPILAQRSLTLDPAEDLGWPELYAALTEMLPDLLAGVLAEIRRTGTISGRPQSGESSFRDLPEREQERLELDWSLPAAELVRRVRVFPSDVNMRAGRRRIHFRDGELVRRRGEIALTGRPAGTIIARRAHTIEVVAGDHRAIRLLLASPLRDHFKMALALQVSSPAKPKPPTSSEPEPATPQPFSAGRPTDNAEPLLRLWQERKRALEANDVARLTQIDAAVTAMFETPPDAEQGHRATATTDAIAKRLDALDQQRSDGRITNAEYARQRALILKSSLVFLYCPRAERVDITRSQREPAPLRGAHGA